MNNSLIAPDQVIQETNLVERLEERAGAVKTIIEAIKGLKRSKDWNTLKIEIFDNLSHSLRKDLLSEAKKDIPDPLRLNRLAGQLKWAEKYANLDKLEQEFTTELIAINKKLHG